MASQEARKTVTVVFADVSGWTGLRERLDPESVRRATVWRGSADPTAASRVR